METWLWHCLLILQFLYEDSFYTCILLLTFPESSYFQVTFKSQLLYFPSKNNCDLHVNLKIGW